ncbi:MAG TPA: DUF4091 domain-containing protein, partial [Bryobacteraceae bacterium]|nr:DUF4091 domain-containing protein [Bryobacteraceae bacterium]
MRLSVLILSAVFAPVLVSAADTVQAWTVDSLVKIFPDDPAGTSRLGNAPVLVPRNGHASVQIALRAPAAVSGINVEIAPAAGVEVQVRRAGYVPVGSSPPSTPFDELARPAPSVFPDPLLVDFPFDLQPNRTESMWITVHAPAAASPGERTLTARITSGGKPLASVPFRVRVANTAVPAQRTLNVTNWFQLEQTYLTRHFKQAAEEERYWELLGNIGRVMAEHGQSAMITPVFSLAKPVVKDGRIEFDFSRLDRWVQVFDKAGIRTIEGGHLLGRASEYFSPLVVPSYVVENGQAVERSLDPSDPAAGKALADFTSALYAHLKTRGWTTRYIQHVHDEPHDDENPVYERYAKLIKQNMPGIPLLDAVGLDQDMSFFVADIWVPVLGSFDHSFDKISDHLGRGGQAWFYTCVFPQGRYLNRFTDLPAIKTRLLHWFNFRHGFTGFLHWGGNYWGPEPFDNVQAVINDNKTLLPAGDNAIVYPDPQRNTILSSIRLEQMREGIEEYEILAELAKKDGAKARALAQRAIPNVNDYVRDVAAFRAIQAELLGEPVPPVNAVQPSKAAVAPSTAAKPQTWFVDALTKVFPDDAAGANRLTQ